MLEWPIGQCKVTQQTKKTTSLKMVRYVQGKPLKDLHKAWRTVAQAHYIKITRKFGSLEAKYKDMRGGWTILNGNMHHLEVYTSFEAKNWRHQMFFKNKFCFIWRREDRICYSCSCCKHKKINAPFMKVFCHVLPTQLTSSDAVM